MALQKKVFGRVEYLGTRYRGWQAQGKTELLTISGVLRHYLGEVLGDKCSKATLLGASRTDAGVHARGNAFHLSLEYVEGASPVSMEGLTMGLNTLLRRNLHPIRILEAKEVPLTFHAHSALRKTYRYQAIVSQSVFHQDRYFLLSHPLDLSLLHQAASLLTGTIPIRSFSKRRKDKPDDPAHRTIENIHLETEGTEVRIYVTGPSFSWRQVRYMAGCLLDCGLGRMSLPTVATLLAGNTGHMAPLAPAEGLTLMEVQYDPSSFDGPI